MKNRCAARGRGTISSLTSRNGWRIVSTVVASTAWSVLMGRIGMRDRAQGQLLPTANALDVLSATQQTLLTERQPNHTTATSVQRTFAGLAISSSISATATPSLNSSQPPLAKSPSNNRSKTTQRVMMRVTKSSLLKESRARAHPRVRKEERKRNQRNE